MGLSDVDNRVVSGWGLQAAGCWFVSERLCRTAVKSGYSFDVRPVLNVDFSPKVLLLRPMLTFGQSFCYWNQC